MSEGAVLPHKTEFVTIMAPSFINKPPPITEAVLSVTVHETICALFAALTFALSANPPAPSSAVFSIMREPETMPPGIIYNPPP